MAEMIAFPSSRVVRRHRRRRDASPSLACIVELIEEGSEAKWRRELRTMTDAEGWQFELAVGSSFSLGSVSLPPGISTNGTTGVSGHLIYDTAQGAVSLAIHCQFPDTHIFRYPAASASILRLLACIGRRTGATT